ncbi:uncharacterized protein LOC129590988 [Paramacrobiotus metropolitanus]|uniref:uncharacterized protein LOC129590988 n=1 Tax=Paramacrobiotus metropolitanus TaxID=2943436 RepID=UPI002445D679|nr:uncharacterized protein LOC129590988 [Paramacrobiotus metropolitanus]
MQLLFVATFAVLLACAYGQAANSVIVAQAQAIVASANKIAGESGDSNAVFKDMGDIMTAVANIGDALVQSNTKLSGRAFNGLSLAGGILNGIGGALTAAGGGGGGK